MSGKFQSPFAPLQLSQYEAGELEELARVLIGQVMDQFETHLTDPTRFVDPVRWKLVKEREDIHVYKERAPSRKRRMRRGTDSGYGQSSGPDEGVFGSRQFAFSVTSEDLFVMDGEVSPFRSEGHAAASLSDENSSDLPILMSVGTIPGYLYDIMYGVANPTTEMMRIKTAYIQDALIDGAVLARLKEPTPDDPFRSLTIKWCVKNQAIHLRTLVNNRDIVYMEATGLGRLPRSGELVGYQMVHSVEFKQTHTIPGCMRGNISVVGLYRQHRDGVVETFGKTFVNPTGRIVRALVVKSAADVVLSSWRTMHTAQMKKLAYAVRRRHAEHPLVDRRQKQPGSTFAVQSSTPTACSLCTKPLSLSSFPLSTKSRGRSCRLCLQVVCSACHCKKKLAAIGPDGALRMVPLSFCVACVHAVVNASAFEIAVDELVQRDAHRGYGDGSDDASFGSSLSPTDTAADHSSRTNSLVGNAL